MRLILVILMICSMYSLKAINDNAGSNGFAFLKIHYSARATAMGGAFTGIANDADAVFFNAAGLRLHKQKNLQTSYINYLEGYQGGSVIFSKPVNETNTFAFFAQYLTSDDMDKTLVDSNGDFIGYDGTFGASNIVFGASVGHYFNEVLDLGASIKFLHESIDEYNSSAIALDLSLMHQTANENIKVGASVKNLGKQLSYYTDSEYKEDFPITISLGLGFHPNQKFYGALDLCKPVNDDISGKIGVEYKFNEKFILRSGYRSNASDMDVGGDLGSFSGISLGFGINWKLYKFDYAASSYGDLGIIHLFGIGYIFK